MNVLNKMVHRLEWLEEKSKPLFVAAALILYAYSLVQLAIETPPTRNLEEFLVQSLINLSIPFGVILLQEMFELITSISHNILVSARRQFEIVVLVIVRSFFKNFAKVNGKVFDGIFGEPVQEAVVKVIAIVAIVLLIILFRHLVDRHNEQQEAAEDKLAVLWKQVVVLLLTVWVLVYQLAILGTFETLAFISLMFTGLIVIDAIFLLFAILRDREFRFLAFESALVISLIFARFPLFTSNTLSYALSVLGVAFAVASLYLLHFGSKLARSDQNAVLDEVA